MTLQLFGKMSNLVCDDYKRMVGKPETSNTYTKSLKIMAELAANKNQEMYKDYIRKTEASPYVKKILLQEQNLQQLHFLVTH